MIAPGRPATLGRGVRVAVTGSSGLIGSAVVGTLGRRGDSVLRLVRRPPISQEEVRWNPAQGLDTLDRLEGLDAIVHLTGAPIDEARWTAERKRLLRDSRVGSTETLVRALALLARPPGALVMASAMGIYGNRGDEVLTESSSTGNGFLARLTRDWEAAAAPARALGVRVVPLRFGLVLTPRGGVLARLLLPFRLGLGGPVGHRDAWWSWIALDDVVGLVLHAIASPALDGAVNAVAPEPVSSAEFARTLGRVLGRPAVMPVPPLALRIAFGELADEGMLASLRVEPKRALASGYSFQWPRLQPALEAMLGR
jgi:uncharacterized protein (TIGR01777 family)